MRRTQPPLMIWYESWSSGWIGIEPTMLQEQVRALPFWLQMPGDGGVQVVFSGVVSPTVAEFTLDLEVEDFTLDDAAKLHFGHRCAFEGKAMPNFELKIIGHEPAS